MARSVPAARLSRWVSAAVAATVAFAGAAALPGGVAAATAPGDAGTPVSVVRVDGFVTSASDSNPDLLVVNYAISVQGQPVTGAVFTTKTFPAYPVDTSTVEVDGSPAPSDTVTAGGHTLTIRMGSGADANNGGVLGVGSYLVSYQQQRPVSAGKDASTTGTLNFNRSGVPGSVSSDRVELMNPDLRLKIPAGSGEDKPAFLGTGRLAQYVAFLHDPGASAPSATVTVKVPDGLRVDLVDGLFRADFDKQGNEVDTALKCKRSGNTVRCALGAVAHDVNAALVVPLYAAKDARPGTGGKFSVAVAADGMRDQNPADNVLTGKVRFTGIARLHAKLVPSRTKVPVGKKVTLRLLITNRGPQPAGMTFAIVLTRGKHFRFVKFVTRHHRKKGPAFVRVPLPASVGSLVEWNAGYIGAGKTAHAHAVYVAKSVGTTRVQFFAGSAAGDPGCDNPFGTCKAEAAVKLHAIKVPRKHSSTGGGGKGAAVQRPALGRKASSAARIS